jgi:outer membrane protein assembly factor BamB
MRYTSLTKAVLLAGALLLAATGAWAQDWPQWRGPNRDSKATGFTEPKTWPKTLTQKWKVNVGQGDASPVLVGDKIYTFTRQGNEEVIRCIDVGSSKELWKDRYNAPATFTGDKAHAGPRSTPAVADGKICTLGVTGILSCIDTDTHKVVWRKDTKTFPQFHTGSSPLIANGKCIAFVGGTKGELVAYDLTNGDSKWKWTGEGAPYGSPVLMTVDGVQMVVTLTTGSLIGVDLAGGKLQWKVPMAAKSNMATPVIDGDTVYCSLEGAGTVAVKVEKQGDKFTGKEVWRKKQGSGKFNTPVLKDGLLYGLSPAPGSNFYCMDARTGDVLWTDKTPRGECGAIVDAGNVLIGLTSDEKLLVFQPSNKEFKQIASYKVGDSATWAYPIVSGNRIFVKDQTTLFLYVIDSGEK